jgi:hypothetical protein
MAWSHKSATTDEPLHFVGAWLQTHYGDFRCNPEDPPLWKYYVAWGTSIDDLKVDLTNPTGLPYAFDMMYRTPANQNSDELISAARARMLLIAVVLGLLIAWWAWRLAGPVAAMIATTAFCLDPNFLAHSPLVKDDVPITLLFLAMMAAVWLLGERATVWRWFLTSLLLSAVLTTKFSGLLGIPMLGIALLLRAISPMDWRMLYWVARTRWQRFFAAVALGTAALIFSYIFLWACYGFHFGSTSDPKIRMKLTSAATLWARNDVIIQHGNPQPDIAQTTDLHQWLQDWRPDRFIRAMYLLDRHHLMPEAWLSGFIYTAATSRLRLTFLVGKIGVNGWWYYFPLAMLFKTPLATLSALALALGCTILFTVRRGASEMKSVVLRGYWPLTVTLVAPVIYMASAMSSSLNIGLRHVLPVYPFIFIFLGVVGAHLWQSRPRITGLVCGVLLLGLAGETFGAYPDYIPFFNLAARSWRDPLDLLSDSNIDWGQELLDLADWRHQHPTGQLYLSYFGAADPAYYGIHFVRMKGAYSVYAGEDPIPGIPRVFAISACSLQGTYVNQEDRAIYERFRGKKPIAILGGSIYIFDEP